MAKTIVTKKGKFVTLLNPAEKAKKAANELKLGLRFTNDGAVKSTELTHSEAAYRMGYLNARRDNANAYKAKRK